MTGCCTTPYSPVYKTTCGAKTSKKNVMAYNQLHSLNNNAHAAKVALAYRDGDQLSAADAAALQLYSGFGGIKTMLFPPTTKEDWLKQGATTEDLRQFHHVMNF